VHLLSDKGDYRYKMPGGLLPAASTRISTTLAFGVVGLPEQIRDQPVMQRRKSVPALPHPALGDWPRFGGVFFAYPTLATGTNVDRPGLTPLSTHGSHP
jgi:hypothetical protein